MSERIVEDGLNPAPDGLTWKKCCGECMFRNDNPQKLTDEEWSQTYFELDMGILTEFYCYHRLDGEHHRICAAFRALYRRELPHV